MPIPHDPPVRFRGEPLTVVDNLLARVGTTRGKRGVGQAQALLVDLSRATIQAAAGIDLDDDDDPMDALFSREFSRESRRLVGAVLLRLIGADEALVEDHGLGVRAYELFDDVFADDIYPARGISVKQQRYEKSRELLDVAPALEEAFEEALAGLTSLAGLEVFRRSFMQTLKSPTSRAIAEPFLPASIDTDRLDGLFRIAAEYRDASDADLPGAHMKANAELTRFIHDAEMTGTTYSRIVYRDLGRKLLALISGEYNKSEVAQPAEVAVLASEKKYPLHELAVPFELRLVVQNRGPGHAFEVAIRLEDSPALHVREPGLYLGHVALQPLIVEVPAELTEFVAEPSVSGEVTWKDSAGREERSAFTVLLEPQAAHVPWDELAGEDPYALEPVEAAADLAGRTEILGGLLALAGAKSLGNAFVTGQKRVGKTSIVKTVAAVATAQEGLPVYLESGDFVAPDAATTVAQLGRAVCKALIAADARLKHLSVPDFADALSPLSEFMNEARAIVPDLRVRIIIDEFDELPIELYKRGPLADALFLTIRSLSGKSFLGFVLVGGEKMDFILSCQGDALNKFERVRVDYFDRERHWSDFRDLVREPVAGMIEIADDAVVALHEASAGNPFFAKLVCRTLLKTAISRRDAHLTVREVDEAVHDCLAAVGSHHFQHFWEDAIFEGGPATEEISMRRRRVLLALGQALRADLLPSMVRIASEASRYGLSAGAVEIEIRDFVRRGILVPVDGGYKCAVPLFQRWLVDRGLQEIITTFADQDAALQRKRDEESAYVRAEEIGTLVARWGTYRNVPVTSEVVRRWLEQFDANSQQRLMFRLLEGIRFYGGKQIRAKLAEGHGTVRRGTTHVLLEGKRRRNDFAVSYLDSAAKSGGIYARMYADENDIYRANVVERAALANGLEKLKDLQGLVFVEDFIATGESAITLLRELDEECGGKLRNAEYPIHLVVVAGFESAVSRVEAEIEALGLPIAIHVCDVLTDADRAFADSSRVFPDSAERERAEQLAAVIGNRLVRRSPLGYGDLQALIVFEHACPNNTLPILWAQAADWHPLFPRL